MSTKKHWETIYTTKAPQEVSWTEEIPQTSIDLIAKFKLPKFAKIVDIGGGDSLLVDHLLALGYTNITILDISHSATERAKKRLGEKSLQVKWIVSNILDFTPPESYDLWHDRAVFHFLTRKEDIETYKARLTQTETSHVVLGTFSKKGPLKCSGLPITQYTIEDINTTFSPQFQIIEAFNQDHITPFDTAQSFTFARMTKKITPLI